MCLQKHLPISGKLSITNYFLKMLLIRKHLTMENNLKVKKRYIISKTSTTFPPRQKTLGERVETNIPKTLENNNCA